MAIVKMKKFKLLVSRTDKESLLRELILLGCVEVSEPDDLLDDPEFAELVVRENADLERYRAEYASLARGISVIEQYAPVKTSMFAAKPDVTDARLLDESNTSVCLELAKSLDAHDIRIRRISVEESNERNHIESLKPWLGLNLPLSTEGTGRSSLVLGSIASSFDFEAFRVDLQTAAPESEVFLVSTNKELHYISVVFLKELQLLVTDVLRRYNFSLSTHRALQGTAQDNIKSAENRIVAYASEKDDLVNQIMASVDSKESLKLCYDHIGTLIARAEAAEKLLGTDYSLLLTGWVPAASEPELLVVLSKFTSAWELSDPLPEEYSNVPVELKNNSLTAPLSMVTEMYSLPAYGSVDPNPVMMPFFVLIYGLMMADMGYGLIMILVAMQVRRKKPTGGMKIFFDLLLLCGVSSFIIGIMTGGIFGDAPQQIAKLLGGSFTLPYTPLFDPLVNTSEILIGAFVLGFVQIVFGMGISMVQQIKKKQYMDAFVDVVAWYLIFLGIALGALGITWWVALAGVAIVVLFASRSNPNILGRIGGGIGKLYDISAYFGDILSYARVMALMLAGGVIATVFNEIGALTGNIFAFLVIFLLGHALNFGLNLIGNFVHDMRLQTLEFFGKFYEDGGKPFKPLRFNTKYNNIVSE